MKMKLFGAAAQTKGAFCAELLTRVTLSSNKVPSPTNGAKSVENADIRSVRTGPVPGKTLPETFQFPLVRPAFRTGSLAKLMARSSKVKSAWKPTNRLLRSIADVVTALAKLFFAKVGAMTGRLT